MSIPSTLKAALEPAVLADVEAALAPPVELRARRDFEIEIEAVGEGTFTLALVNQRLVAKKGFAKKPLVSAHVSKGGFDLVRRVLDAALAGFPAAPELARSLARLRAPRPGDLDAVLAAIEKLPDVCIRCDVKGIGAFALSRGPMDEAAHELRMTIDAAALEGVVAGKPFASLKAELSGDRGVVPTVLAAIAPLTALLRAA